MKRLHKIQDRERISSSFQSFLKKPLPILAIFFVLFSSGCTDINGSESEAETVETAADINNSVSGAGLVEVTDLSQIDEALDKGPVVLKLGSKRCIPVRNRKRYLQRFYDISG